MKKQNIVEWAMHYRQIIILLVSVLMELKELQRPLELMRNHQTSLMLTPEYELLRKNIEVQNLQKKIEIGKQLPSVGIGAGYMHDYIFDKNNSYGIAFATISVPISDWWGGSHAIKRRKIQLKIAQDELKDNSELLILKMQKNWNELDDAYQQILLSNKSIEQASENLRLHEDYYKAGTVNMYFFIQARDEPVRGRAVGIVISRKYAI